MVVLILDFVHLIVYCVFVFFFQAEDGIRDADVTGVQTCALPIYGRRDQGNECCGRREPMSTHGCASSREDAERASRRCPFRARTTSTLWTCRVPSRSQGI